MTAFDRRRGVARGSRAGKALARSLDCACAIVLLVAVLFAAAPGRALEGAPVRAERVALIGMPVSDMERSIAFYERVLEFEKVSDLEVTGPAWDRLQGAFAVRMRIVHLRLGDETIELIEYVAPPDGRPIPVPSHSNDLWFQHMAIVVSDMDKAWDALRRARVRQISPEPQTLPKDNPPAAGIRAIKFRDPDNHNLELLWFPEGKGDPRWRKPSNRLFLGLDHTAITVGDTERSLAFYRDLLGLKVAGGSLNTGITQELLDGVFTARVRVTGIDPARRPPGMEFLQYETPPGGRPIPLDTAASDLWRWQTTIAVADLDAAARALRAAGAPFVSPDVVRLPDDRLGFSRGFTVLDPDRHAVRLVDRLP